MSGTSGWGPPPGVPDHPVGPPTGAPGFATNAAPAATWQPAAPKPGVIPLRPLSVGEVLDGGFSTLRRHPAVTFGLAAVLIAVLEVARVIVGLVYSDVGGAFGAGGFNLSSSDIDSDDTGFTSLFWASTAVDWIVGGLLTVILTGMVTVVVGQAAIGRSVSFAIVRERMRGQWLRLIGASLIAALLPWAGWLLFLLAIPGVATDNAALIAAGIFLGAIGGTALAVWLWGRLALTTSTLILERTTVRGALRRGWRLTRGGFWRVWGIRALSVLIAQVATFAVSVPFLVVGYIVRGGISSGAGSDAPVLFAVALASAIGWIITQPFTASVLTILYVDRRMRLEALDLELARAAAGSDSQR